jgi:hypothetical protein
VDGTSSGSYVIEGSDTIHVERPGSTATVLVSQYTKFNHYRRLSDGRP